RVVIGSEQRLHRRARYICRVSLDPSSAFGTLLPAAAGSRRWLGVLGACGEVSQGWTAGLGPAEWGVVSDACDRSGSTRDPRWLRDNRGESRKSRNHRLLPAAAGRRWRSRMRGSVFYVREYMRVAVSARASPSLQH